MQHGIDPYCFTRTVQYYYVFIEDVHKARLSLEILIIYHVSLFINLWPCLQKSTMWAQITLNYIFVDIFHLE